MVNDYTLSMEHVGNINVFLDECLEYREEKRKAMKTIRTASEKRKIIFQIKEKISIVSRLCDEK